MDTLFANELVERREVIEYLLSRLNTSCPGTVRSFDPTTQTVTAQPAIQMKVVRDGITTYLDMPDIIMCPCVVPSVAIKGFALTLPISTGDPCLINFSQRCIDNWLALGGSQPPEDSPATTRHHQLTDAIVTFAPTPLPQVLTDWLMDGIELRNRARNSRVTVLDAQVEIHVAATSIVVKNDGTVVITAPTECTVSSPLTHFTGDVGVDGNIVCLNNITDATRSMAADRLIFDGHTHTDPQGGNVSVPGTFE